MAEKEVIREFLVALGVQIDQGGAKKFVSTVLGMCKIAGQTSATIAGVAVAVEAMTSKFAHNMEKLYYASRRTKASAENIQALDFAASQVGLHGDEARVALEGMAKAIRLNPGLTGLLKNLGIAPEGKDTVHTMIDLVKQLAKMPHYIGAQYAAMFGMDEETFLMMKDDIPKLEAAAARRITMNREAGVNADEAAAASKRYMNTLRELWERVEVLGNGIAVKLLPYFDSFNTSVNNALNSFSKTLSETDMEMQWGAIGAAVHAVKEEFQGLFNYLSTSIPDAVLQFGNMMLALKRGQIGKALDYSGALVAALVDGTSTPDKSRRSASGKIGGLGGPTSAPGGGGGATALFAGLERTYGLPAGLLDRMWAQESGRGTNMLSKAGAQGHFQFMPATAAEYGIAGKENDLTSSAGAAARYMSDLARRYGGDFQMALAAYNGGMGNLDKKGLGGMPSETKDYVSKIGGPGGINLTANTKIDITGGDAAENGRAVGSALDKVYADLVRNGVGAVR